jgi:hypothetical protein
LDLAVRGVQLKILLLVLESGILCTWPNQLSLRALMWLIISVIGKLRPAGQARPPERFYPARDMISNLTNEKKMN